MSRYSDEQRNGEKIKDYISAGVLSFKIEGRMRRPEYVSAAVEYYREYFSGTGVYQNVLLEGVPELLQSLKAHGRTVAVASSKPEHFVRLILAHFQVDAYFDEICGASMDESRINKEDVIEELLGRLGLSEADQKRVLMVGDRRHDVEGAAQFGIPCLGLSLGFAAEGELERAGAVAVADSMEAVGAFILRDGRTGS